jgi:peptidyl-prolyl cis-trans isomerase-like 3
MKMEVYCDQCPRAAFNFLALAASEQYNGTLFHRSINQFMLQGGDPTSTGKGGGESIHGGPMADEFVDNLKHDRRGIVGFAGKGPDTIGSQFFITYAAAPHLDNQFTIFGSIVDGFDTLDKIEAVPVGKKNKPVQDIVLERITIHANPLAHNE